MLDPARINDVLRKGAQYAPQVAEWRAIDEQRRALQGTLDHRRAERNAANETMAKLDKKSDDFATARDRLRELSSDIKSGEAALAKLEDDATGLLMRIPNAPHASVPDGAGPDDNPVLHVWGEKPRLAFAPKQHFDLGGGILDFEAGTRLAGARFTVLRGWASRLTRALVQYMLDLHTSRGYEEAWPPAIVNRASLTATGQLPKFEEDLFKLDLRPPPEKIENEYFLSPTAEVQLCNLHRDEILDGAKLPIRYAAYAPCFRAEAGAYGKDTRGLIRQHQFDKVELVAITSADASYAELEKMRGDAEAVLQGLGLHYRVVTLCTGDMGFASTKTYDLEVWLPGQDAYREISSVSNCEDFQARRAKIRFRAAAGEKPRPAHTLNGSGVAIGRTLVAIFEQYQQADGSIAIPAALRPHCGGADVVPAKPMG